MNFRFVDRDPMDDAVDLADRSYREGVRDGRVQAAIVAFALIVFCAVAAMLGYFAHA